MTDIPPAHEVTVFEDETGLWCWKCWDCPSKGYGNNKARQVAVAHHHALQGGGELLAMTDMTPTEAADFFDNAPYDWGMNESELRTLIVLIDHARATPPPAGSGVVVDKDALVGELRSIIEWVSERDHNKAIALDQVVYDLETRAAGSGVTVDRDALASAMYHALEEAVRARGVTPGHVYADIEAVAAVALAEIERQRGGS